MVALSMSIVAVYLTCFYISIVVTEVPICGICASTQPTPAPQTDSGAPAPFPSADSPETNLPGRFDVTEHGAVADGKTESSAAFIAAWDAACSYAGNSIFYIPEGSFLLGPITFRGPCYNNQPPNVEIKGALLALPNLSAFPDFNWIVFEAMQGLNLSGRNEVATLDAQGGVEAWKQNNCSQSEKCDQLITSLKFANVSYGTIKNITVLNSKGFHVGFNGCDNIDIHDVNITAPWDSPNTDGIHVSESTNINITSSTIGVGDDCVSIGPGSINVSVSDVNCGPGHGFSIGSLGKYPNEKDVVGIIVRNCTINGTQNGVRVKTWPGAPESSASNFTFEDITTINVSNPIIIDQEYCPSNSCNTSEPSQVKLSNIYFKNISGTYNTPSGVTLFCSSGVPCENIQLADINLDFIPPETSRQGRFSVKGIIHGLEILSSSF